MKRIWIFILLCAIFINRQSGTGVIYIKAEETEAETEIPVLTYDKEKGQFTDGNGIWYESYTDDEETYMAPVGCDSDVETLKLPSYVRVGDNKWKVIMCETFFGTENLKKIVYPADMNMLTSGNMRNCPNLDEVVVPPGNPYHSARDGCIYNAAGNSLQKVMPGVRRLVLDDTVRKIDGYAFMDSQELKELYISSNVRELQPGFLSCSDSYLEKLEVAEENPLYMSDEQGNVLSKDGKRVIQLVPGRAEVTVPEGVEEINAVSSYGCVGMTTLKLPSSIRYIAEPWEFFSCHNTQAELEKIEISTDNPYYCTDDKGGVYNADKTELLRAPRKAAEYAVAPTVKKINRGAFRYSSIGSIEIPESVICIEQEAFAQLDGCKSIRIPASVLYMGDHVFKYCNVAEIRFDSGGCRIGKAPYENARSQLTVYGYSGSDEEESTKESAASFVSLGDWSPVVVDGVRYALSGDTCSVLEAAGLEQETLELPEKIEWEGKEYRLRMIQPEAFQGEVKLKTIQIPDSVEQIGESAFCDCSSLTEAKLPSGLRQVRRSLFQNCVSLKKIMLPDTVEEIQRDAFSHCIKLMSLTIPEQTGRIGGDSDRDMSNIAENANLLTIYGKKGSLAEAYASQYTIPFRDVADSPLEGTEGPVKETEGPEEETKEPVQTLPSAATSIPEETGEPAQTLPSAETHEPEKTLFPGGMTEWQTAKPEESFFTAGMSAEEPTISSDGTSGPTGRERTAHPADTLLRDDKNQCMLKVIAVSGKKRQVSYEGAVKKKRKEIIVPGSVSVDGVAYDVTAAGAGAFRGDLSVKKITLGKKVEVIGAAAFRGCRNLKTLVVLSKKLKIVEKHALKGTAKKLVIYVPASCIKQYRKQFRGKGNAVVQFRILKELGLMQAPQIRLTKGVAGTRKYVQVKLLRYQGTYAEFFVKNKEDGKYVKLKTKGGTIRKNGRKYRFQYQRTDMKLSFRIRTYRKKGRKKYYSCFSSVVRIRV